jgi:carboxyl-terminal processing protease
MRDHHSLLALLTGLLLTAHPLPAQEREPNGEEGAPPITTPATTPSGDPIVPFEAAGMPAGDDSEAYEALSVLTDVLMLIREDYYNADKIGYKQLIYNALEGMLGELDPHSHFMNPDSFQKMQDNTRSITHFGDLGVVISTKNGLLTVVSAYVNTPASRAGLRSGDQILKIDGKSTESIGVDEAIQLLQGEPGQSVKLTILRPSTRDVLDFTLVREVIRIPSVKGTRMLPQEDTGGRKIGYIYLVQFNSPTADVLEEEIAKLERQGLEGLVLDLRNNPGGLLDSAIDVCSLFLGGDQIVVYTEGRRESQRKIYRTAPDPEHVRTFPLVILTNGGSASGAEIVAGALKDLNRAVIVGETTFGKGSVQSVIQLRDDSAVKLTTAKYYTPSRQQIHEVGISPHITATLTADEERALDMQRNQEEYTPEELASTANFRDSQLDRAVDALQGLLIYRAEVAQKGAEVRPFPLRSKSSSSGGKKE